MRGRKRERECVIVYVSVREGERKKSEDVLYTQQLKQTCFHETTTVSSLMTPRRVKVISLDVNSVFVINQSITKSFLRWGGG